MKTPENTPVNDCSLKNYCYLCSHNHGVVLEWLKRHAWKACIPQKGIPSSNLGHSANNQRQKSRKHTCLRDFLPFAPPPRKRGAPQTQSQALTSAAPSALPPLGSLLPPPAHQSLLPASSVRFAREPRSLRPSSPPSFSFPSYPLSLSTMPRDYRHDYKSRCIYHITITKAPHTPPLSHITGSPSQVTVQRTPIGQIIEQQLRGFHHLHPALRVLQYTIMPDHIHFAIFVQEPLPKPIGSYIGMMKVKCGQIARELHAIQTPVFEKDFYDRILRRYHSLDTICEYIRQNPYRLLIRRLNPQFFSKTTNITIRDTQLQAYGNLQLLDNPFKAPVVIHRADSEAIRSAKLNHLAESITQPIALTKP